MRINLLTDAAAAPATGPTITPPTSNRTFQASVTNGGAATVVIEGSNDGNFLALGTITLTAGTPSDGFVSTAKWEMVRARLTAISGASAAVTVTLGA